MTKIREVVQINSGYTSYVDLYEEYNDIAKNRGRMERYKPIAAHRIAFEKIANALNPLDRRFYFLSGSYGTGKSHLLLMLANYFANPSDVPEIETFFKNYQEAQEGVLLRPGDSLNERKALSLKEARKSGKYLIALCRYSLNLDFESALLRALEEALEKDDSNLHLDTHYHEAIRRINDWKDRQNKSKFYNDLERVIGTQYPDLTVNKLLGGLEKFDEHALSAFKDCFQRVTDTYFHFSKDNLRDIISDLFKNQDFKDKYKGIVFLYDEFGSAIDANLVGYAPLLDFAQFCANSTIERGGSVIFIGAGHKTFTQHGKAGDWNAETLAARITEVQLVAQGMEDIIAAIVHPKKDSSEWESIQHSPVQKFTFHSAECNRLHLFNWLPAPKIKLNIIENIYPMHPLATFSLLRLASEAGSDNRSVLKFFAPEFETGDGGWTNVQAFSYPDFLEIHEIFENGKLSLYTSDLLVDYFKDSLKTTNSRLTEKVKTSIINYEATLQEMNTYLARKSQDQLFEEMDELMTRIIKVMLVNEIASTQGVSIANTAPNIEFALDYESQAEKNQVEQRLKLLSNAAIIYNNNGVFELMRGDRKDPRRIVDQYKSNPDNKPTHLLQQFLEFNPLRNDEAFLEAKDYNTQFNEDKRLKVVFATPEMLNEQRLVEGRTLPFYAALEQERLLTKSLVNGYEGIAVHVFCENENDINQSKRFVAKNDQSRIVVAIPKAPISVYDAIFTLKALASDLFRSQAQDFGPFEKALEKQIRDEALKVLTEAKASYFSNAKVSWFGKNGIEIPTQEGKRNDVANHIMHEFYGKVRNTFPHPEFNRSHANLIGAIRSVFKEAGDILCDTTQSIRINWGWADNRGGTKYLRRCFLDHQVLQVFRTEGDNRYLEPEKDKNKFRSFIPAYAALLENLAKLESQGQTNFVNFIRPFFEVYGQGEIAVTLMMLLARRYYGDSLRFKRESNTLVDIQFTNTEDMLSLVQGNSPAAVILFEPVSPEDLTYFAKITQIFSNQPAPAGEVYSISEAFQSATTWWGSLPIVARSMEFYTDEDRPLAEGFSQTRTKDPFQFIKHNLMELLGQIPGKVLSTKEIDEIESKLKRFKLTAESIQENLEDQILSEVAKIFGIEKHLDLDIQEAFRNWYDALSSTQKDPVGSYHNNDSLPLVKITSYVDIRELLFKKLPMAYAYDSVNNWSSNLTAEYMRRISSGKKHIDTLPPLSQPTITFENDISQNGNLVKYKGELKIKIGTDDGKGIIYYTDDGTDPISNRDKKILATNDSIDIRGNQRIKIVVADEHGNYSAVKVIDAVDELQKYKITRKSQPTLLDEFVSFVFPTEKDAAEITISSLFSELVNSHIFSSEELEKHILAILKSKK